MIPATLKFKNLLIVDDEGGIRKMLQISLGDLGYSVFTAENGKDALSIFNEKKPMIVLTDIKMPGMDGIELLQRIRSVSGDVKVIMLTGHGDMDLAIKSLKYGAMDFITKPIHDEILEAALKRAEERLAMEAAIRYYTENLERMVQEQTEKLIEKERMAAVGEMVQELSHAIKNIASGLGGGVFVVEKGLEMDDRDYLLDGWQMVRRNLERIRTLSLDLLNFSGRKQPQFKRHDPNEVLNDVCLLMNQRASENRIRIRAIPLASSSASFLMDSEMIVHALVNLVSNAIDACLSCEKTRDSYEITVACEETETFGLAFRVSDQCGGLPKDEIHRIFDPFFKSQKKEGFGIGLILTRKIVDLHGGCIEVESREGEGTSVLISLPERSL